MGHGRGRLEPFSDSIATGLGWLFSVQGVVVGFVMTIISSLLIAVIVDEPSYDLIGGWIGDRRRTLYLRWLDAAENKLQRFFGSHLLGLRAFDRCLLLALAYPLFLLLLAWVLGAAPGLGGASLLDASLAWPQRALVVVGIVLAVF